MLRILLVSLAVAQAKDVPNGHEIEAPGLASSQTSWVDLTRKITMVMQNGAGDDHVALAVTGHRRKLDHDECADGSSDWHYVSPGVRPSLHARRRSASPSKLTLTSAKLPYATLTPAPPPHR